MKNIYVRMRLLWCCWLKDRLVFRLYTDFLLSSLLRSLWMRWPSKTPWRATTCTPARSAARRSARRKGGTNPETLLLKTVKNLNPIVNFKLFLFCFTGLVSRNCLESWASTPWDTPLTWWPWWRKRSTRTSPSLWGLTWPRTRRTSSWERASAKTVRLNALASDEPVLVGRPGF